jgi:hypothetical protein
MCQMLKTMFAIQLGSAEMFLELAVIIPSTIWSVSSIILSHKYPINRNTFFGDIFQHGTEAVRTKSHG